MLSKAVYCLFTLYLLCVFYCYDIKLGNNAVLQKQILFKIVTLTIDTDKKLPEMKPRSTTIKSGICVTVSCHFNESRVTWEEGASCEELINQTGPWASL